MSRFRVVALALAGALALGVPSLPSSPAGATCPGPVPPPGGIDCPDTTGVGAPVLGYIVIHHFASLGLPFTYQLGGALGEPSLFTCTSATLAGGEFKVTCVPQPNNTFTWRCDVLHVVSMTASANGRLRTAMDCDGQAPAEVQTTVVTGVGGHDTKLGPANVAVTEFSCTVDGGTLPRSPDYLGGCGDPGLVTLR